MLAMQLIMNADPDKYGSLIEGYDQDFLSGEKKYPKPPLDAYNLLKGWNKHRNTRGPIKVRLSFNNNGEEDGTTLTNDGSKSKRNVPNTVMIVTRLLIVMPKSMAMEQPCIPWATSRRSERSLRVMKA